MLNSEQSLALNAAVSGHNLLIYGQAGTGKTHTVKSIYKTLSKERKVVLLCTTGMACLQYSDFDARTVHSWAGLYDGRYDILTLRHLVLNDDKFENIRENVKSTEVIIIDEISMLSQKLFEQVEAVCSVVRNPEKYFGGIQIILCGDFYQLAPVPDELHNDNGQFCFESKVFKNCITHKYFLKQVMRQEEELLIKAVRESAVGTVSEETDIFLKSLSRPLPTDINTVHLFAKNIDSTIFNNECLEKSTEEGKIYKAVQNTGSNKYLNKILAINYLHLKINCPVILLVNLGGKLVNGLKGSVKYLKDETVTVFFSSINETHEIKRYLFSKYSVREKCVVAQREQFPLVLGYSMTIHKAQGMTLQNVAVNCKGIFQPGQLSVAIGRAVSSNNLQLLNYRKGLCYIPKPVISKFYNTESCQYLTDFSCCLNKVIKITGTETETVPNDDSDSDFDVNEIDFIEQNLFEDTIGVTESQLPGYINVEKLKSLNILNEPVTDLHRKMNKLCENCDIARLTNFCKVEYNRIKEELLSTVSPDISTKSKEWTSILASNHQHMTSVKYCEEVKNLFCVKELSPVHKHFATNIITEILKLSVHNIAERVTFGQQSVPAASMSDAGKGKIRHVGGMCVAKISQHYISCIMSNQNNPDKNIQKSVKESEIKLKLLKQMVADGDLDYQTDKTLQEIERKQNVRKALTYISDLCFQFFLNLNGKVNRLLSTEMFKLQKKNVFDYTFSELEKDEDMQMLFSELFMEDNAIPDIIQSLYGEIVQKYLMVCHKQLLKDTKDRLNIVKKTAHRQEIKKKTEKRKSEIELSLKDIATDSSENKDTSHMKLKLNCMANENYLTGREFTKAQLMKLCSAYGVAFTKSMRKTDIANVLRENIIKAEKVLNPDLLSADVSEPSTSNVAQPRKRAKIPGKGKGKGKGKKAAAKTYYCQICAQEYVDGEEWLQCDDCHLWFHRTCGDISDEVWEELQLEEYPWACKSCSA